MLQNKTPNPSSIPLASPAKGQAQTTRKARPDAGARGADPLTYDHATITKEALRAVRHYGYAHPAVRATRERVAFYTGRPLHLPVRPPKPPAPAYLCPCCGEPMAKLPLSLLPLWKTGLSPSRKESCA